MTAETEHLPIQPVWGRLAKSPSPSVRAPASTSTERTSLGTMATANELSA